MIVQNAYGQAEQVESLLRKAMIQWNAKVIRDWMHRSFDPEHMFCFYEENKLICVLQTQRTQMKFKNKTIAVSTIQLAATLPDYQNRGYFKALLDAFLDKASHNELFSYVYTQSPKLFESRSFTSITCTKEYWISSKKITKGNPHYVSFYKKGISLYPLYKEFLSRFDGSITYSEKEFNHLLSTYVSSNKNIVISKDKDENINGFACYENIDNYVRIYSIVYLNGNAINNILSYLSFQKIGIFLITSPFERIDKLIKVDPPKHYSHYMFRLNNHKLFSELMEQNLRNVKVAFDQIDRPQTNHI